MHVPEINLFEAYLSSKGNYMYKLVTCLSERANLDHTSAPYKKG